MITDYTKIFVIETTNKQTEHFRRKSAGVHSILHCGEIYRIFNIIVYFLLLYVTSDIIHHIISRNVEF